MIFNITSQLYVYNRTFSSLGIYEYNISCNGSVLGFELLIENDTVNITGDVTLPVVVIVDPDNRTWSNTGDITFYYNATDDIGVSNLV